MLKIIGTYKWLPKKLSKLNINELNILSRKFKIIYDELNESNCSLIEDNFTVGFKLKLMQMLFNGDIVFSRVDLKSEIENLSWVHNVITILDIPLLSNSIEPLMERFNNL